MNRTLNPETTGDSNPASGKSVIHYKERLS